jgi:hypothetical protein
VRSPSAFSITFGLPPSNTDTQELVVPKSMPIILPMILLLNFCVAECIQKLNCTEMLINGSICRASPANLQRAAHLHLPLVSILELTNVIQVPLFKNPYKIYFYYNFFNPFPHHEPVKGRHESFDCCALRMSGDLSSTAL